MGADTHARASTRARGRSGVLAYLRTRLGLLLRSRVMLATVTLLAIACAASSLAPIETSFGPALYHQRRDALAKAMKSGEVQAHDGETGKVLLAYDATLVALEQARSSSQASWQEFLANVARAAELADELDEAGICPYGTGGIPSEAAMKAELELVGRLGDGGWPVYASTAWQPALYRLACMAPLLPGALWSLPALVTACVLALDRSQGRLLAQAPVRPVAAGAIDLALAWLVGTLMVALAWGVGALAALRNGVGSLDYPVVIADGSDIVSITMADSLARTLSVLLCSSLLMASAASAASLGRRPWVGGLTVGGGLAGCALIAQTGRMATLDWARTLDVVALLGTPAYPGEVAWDASALVGTLPTETLLALPAICLVATIASLGLARHTRRTIL